MAAGQKPSTYLLEAENRLHQLYPERLQLAIAFLAYLQKIEGNELKEKLLSIPGFAAASK